MTLSRKMTALFAALALFGVQMAPLHAAMVSTGEVIQQQQHQLAKGQLLAALERTEVREKLAAMGVDADDAKARVATLTEAELAELNHGINELPAGSDILSLAVTVFIVLVITDIIGATDVFSFVHPIR